MRLLRVVPFIVLSACASSTSSAPATAARPATQTVRSTDIGSITISTNSSAEVSKLAYAVDAVWRIMPSVFDSVGIPLTTVDQAQKRIGNEGYKTRARLAKAPLSRYLDCGNTQIGPNADSYDVFLTVITTVAADGPSGVTLTTMVDAQAKPITYNQGYSRCSSKGTLERRIVELVNARLAK